MDGDGEGTEIWGCLLRDTWDDKLQLVKQENKNTYDRPRIEN